MESLNQVLLAGKVTGLDPRNQDAGRSLRFTVTTNQMYFESGERKMDPEVHSVKLLDPKTISKYIRIGKNIVLTGRMKYQKDGSSYILASQIHFAGGTDAD